MYLPPLSMVYAALASGTVCFELGGWYQKRSYRNRGLILGPTGIQTLSIPLEAGKNSKMPLKDVRIAYQSKWQLEHQNAFKTAYQNSAFFSLLHPEFQTIWAQKPTFLVDFHHIWWENLIQIAQLPIQTHYRTDFVEDPSLYIDARNTYLPTSRNNETPYFQVFHQKNGFQSDLTAWDKVFHLGKL